MPSILSNAPLLSLQAVGGNLQDVRERQETQGRQRFQNSKPAEEREDSPAYEASRRADPVEDVVDLSTGVTRTGGSSEQSVSGFREAPLPSDRVERAPERPGTQLDIRV